MPRHAAWHCIIQQAALCCFISSVAVSVLSLGSHSSTWVTSKHGQPTCLHWRVYGEVNDDTWRRAALVDRHEVRHGTKTCSTGGRRTARWPVSLVDRCTAQSPARVTGLAAQVFGTVSAVGRYNCRTGGRLSHNTELCTVFVLAWQYSARYLAP